MEISMYWFGYSDTLLTMYNSIAYIFFGKLVASLYREVSLVVL